MAAHSLDLELHGLDTDALFFAVEPPMTWAVDPSTSSGSPPFSDDDDLAPAYVRGGPRGGSAAARAEARVAGPPRAGAPPSSLALAFAIGS